MGVEKLSLLSWDLFITINFLILFCFLFFRKNNSLSNKILAFILLTPTVIILTTANFHLSSESYKQIEWNYFSCVSSLLFGPLVLYYLQLMQGKKIRIDYTTPFHFIPSLMALIIGLYFSEMDNTQKQYYHKQIVAGEEVYTNILFSLVFIQIAVYLIIGKLQIKKYEKQTDNYYSNQDKLHIRWMNFFVNNLLLQTATLLLIFIIVYSFFPDYIIYADLVGTPLVAFIFYTSIIHRSFSYHAVFDKDTYLALVEENKPIEGLPEFKNPVPEDIHDEQKRQLEEVKKELDELFLNKKIFCKNQLNLQQLADTAGYNKSIVSQTINRLYGTSFSGLINNLRVEETRKLLVDDQYKNLKIDAIGELAGFSSRTNFFSVFKKVTGHSPMEYRNNIYEKNTETPQVNSFS